MHAPLGPHSLETESACISPLPSDHEETARIRRFSPGFPLIEATFFALLVFCEVYIAPTSSIVRQTIC